MAPEAVPYGRKTQKPSPVPDIHILWITAGLGCDGDSVSVTAAMQPSIEDVLLGAIPGLPKVTAQGLVDALKLPIDERGKRRAAARAEWIVAATKPLDTHGLLAD